MGNPAGGGVGTTSIPRGVKKIKKSLGFVVHKKK